ncbi:nucleoside-diphosphate kinase [Candidatus Pacearchaeota archaeon]|nr:nucleoside-diphosphate kinase [Candidatus Pacearchaeota archaeon]
MVLQRTLILIKPDGVERGLIGECVRRFEQRGIKIIGMKMVWIDKEHAKKHYTEDITRRRGERVRQLLLDFIISGPVVAIVLEGVNVVEIARKIVGETEPRVATPGTIRGDFAHISFVHADEKNKTTPNLIHASASPEEARQEIELWFKEKEMHSYKTVQEKHTL